MKIALLLLCIGSAVAQSPFSGRTRKQLESFVNFELHATQFKIGKAISYDDVHVVWKVNNVSLSLEHSKTVDQHAESDLTEHSTVMEDPSPYCQRQNWYRVGTANIPFNLTKRVDYRLYQTIEYGELVSYLYFPPPTVSFTIQAWLSVKSRRDCEFKDADSTLATQFVPREQLCYTQGKPCNFYFGEIPTGELFADEPGWYYLGEGANKDSFQYAIHLEPTWSWFGSRLNTTLVAPEYINVVTSAKAMPATRTTRSYYELNSLTTEPGSMVRFYTQSGFLARGLACRTCKFAGGTQFLFTLPDVTSYDSRFLNKTSGEMDFVMPRFVTALSRIVDAGEATTLPAQWEFAAYFLPTDWVVSRHQFSLSADLRELSVSFSLRFNGTTTSGAATTTASGTTVGGATTTQATPTSTTTAPAASTTTTATIPVFRCAFNCNGHGQCVAQDTCQCAQGWVASTEQGCAFGAELMHSKEEASKTTAPMTVLTVASAQVSTPSFTTATRKTDAPIMTDPEAETMPRSLPSSKEPSNSFPLSSGDIVDFFTQYLIFLIVGISVCVLCCILCIVGIVCLVVKGSNSGGGGAAQPLDYSGTSAIQMQTDMSAYGMDDEQTGSYAGVGGYSGATGVSEYAVPQH